MDVSFIDDIKDITLVTGANPTVVEGTTKEDKLWRLGLMNGLATLSIEDDVVAKTELPFETKRGFFVSDYELEYTLQELFDAI